MIDLYAPCYNCQVRTDCCHVGCPAYQSYARKCRELNAQICKEKETDKAIIDLRIRQKDRLRRRTGR